MSHCSHAASGCNYPEGECIGTCQACSDPRPDCMGMLVDGIGDKCAAVRSLEAQPETIQEPLIFVKFTRSIDGVGLTADEFKALKAFAHMMAPDRTPERQPKPLDKAFGKIEIAASRVNR
jgi:hypothetical protein